LLWKWGRNSKIAGRLARLSVIYMQVGGKNFCLCFSDGVNNKVSHIISFSSTQLTWFPRRVTCSSLLVVCMWHYVRLHSHVLASVRECNLPSSYDQYWTEHQALVYLTTYIRSSDDHQYPSVCSVLDNIHRK